MAYLIFDFFCPVCEYQEERMIKDGKKNKCKKCGNEMNKLIPSPAMLRTNAVDKTWVRGKK